eukprot:CAMPEP_0172308160 /NCGR_PEP_ID=MMETSP1058-20130122/8852_1 /TAXON_ID=83371 /ORGANISM="Detonula confervacea, Strain CCMP 353" /LENGTH=55 /DNA_ID=CAMNT_0013020519 /DNA_START=756 /DNA_END=922 /DNA_ORIENTATION=-
MADIDLNVGPFYGLSSYVTSDNVEPHQATAIFAPLPGANHNQDSATWIPPPAFVP